MGCAQSTRRPHDGLRRGVLLRMELSSPASLAIQPRRGRMLAELRTRWQPATRGSTPPANTRAWRAGRDIK
jgi:hypothetical protein